MDCDKCGLGANTITCALKNCDTQNHQPNVYCLFSAQHEYDSTDALIYVRIYIDILYVYMYIYIYQLLPHGFVSIIEFIIR